LLLAVFDAAWGIKTFKNGNASTAVIAKESGLFYLQALNAHQA